MLEPLAYQDGEFKVVHLVDAIRICNEYHQFEITADDAIAFAEWINIAYICEHGLWERKYQGQGDVSHYNIHQLFKKFKKMIQEDRMKREIRAAKRALKQDPDGQERLVQRTVKALEDVQMELDEQARQVGVIKGMAKMIGIRI